jgi:DNA-binding transcriptional LysR family regulator
MMIMEPDRWLGVELRHLAALKALADEGSFGRAATSLGYTQSAVSQQIAALERIVGMRLVERPGGPRAVALTEAGRLLLRHAESITARLRAAQADLNALAQGESGTLRIGTIQSVGAKVLPTVLQRFTAEWPSVEILLRESAHEEELAALVESGDLDLAFVQLPIDADSLEPTEVLRDPWVLLVPADSPLVERERPPTLKEVATLKLIGYRDCRATRTLEGQLRTSGLDPTFVFRSDDNSIIQGMVAAGVGAAIVPRLAVDESSEGVRIVDLGERLQQRRIGIVWHRDRYQVPAATAFVDTARAVCAELQERAPVAAQLSS